MASLGPVWPDITLPKKYSERVCMLHSMSALCGRTDNAGYVSSCAMKMPCLLVVNAA